MLLLKCAVFVGVFSIVLGFKIDYNIGGLFNDEQHEAAFKVIIEHLNKENPDVPFDFSPKSAMISSNNTMQAKTGVCNLLKDGVIGLFGPSSPHTSHYIQSICDQKEMPQVEVHYDRNIDRNKCLVNFHPHPDEIFNFFKHLISIFDWKKMVVLFEDNTSLLKITPLLELSTDSKVGLIFMELEKDDTGSYRTVLNGLKKMSEFNIFLDCSTDILKEVLTQCQQVGIITENYHYIITNLDMSSVDLEPFQYGGANISGIRLFDPQSEKAQNMRSKIIEEMNIPEENQDSFSLKLSTALLIDSVTVFHEVLKEISTNNEKLIIDGVDCSTSNTWKYGFTIINLMKGKEIEEMLTGRIKFDGEGFRRDFSIDLVELAQSGLEKVAEWNTTTKVLVDRRPQLVDVKETIEFSLFNRTFRVIICLTDPYIMIKQIPEQLVGNDRYEGFGVDVIQELSAMLGFNYTIVEQKDGIIGNLHYGVEWDGMIRAIIDEEADLAITDLTITAEREKAVDFTMPFMNLGISILYRKPKPVPPSLFMFLSPFSTGVWIMLGVAYLFVSFSIFIMGRLSPSEWTSPFPCIEEPEFLINQFSIKNCLWFTIGGLLQQGSELAPIGISIRTISGFWWFFVLIMVSSYTATLAAFLTVETLVTPFKNIDELSKQTLIQYGAKRQGATENFFKNSNLSTYKRVWKYMEEHPEVMTSDNEEGVKRVKKMNYAYFMESTTIEYVVQRHCTLAQVGGLLDDKGYGIAMKKDSPYRNELSRAILKLQETGVLTKLKIKWWKEKRGGSTCSVVSKKSEAEALGLKNVGGVFLVLFVGAILSLVGSFLEMSASIYKKTKSSPEPFNKELKKELALTVKFKTNVKQVVAEDADDNDDNKTC